MKYVELCPGDTIVKKNSILVCIQRFDNVPCAASIGNVSDMCFYAINLIQDQSTFVRYKWLCTREIDPSWTVLKKQAAKLMIGVER